MVDQMKGFSARDGVIFEIVVFLSGAFLFLLSFSAGVSYGKLTLPQFGQTYTLFMQIVGAAFVAFSLVFFSLKVLKSNSEPKQAQFHVISEDEGLVTTREQEIEIYWGYRPLATGPLSETIISCSSSVVISGMGLNSMEPLFSDSAVLEAIADKMISNKDFSLSLIFVDSTDSIVLGELGGRPNLENRIESGRKVLDKLLSDLKQRVSNNILANQLHLLSYHDGFLPRHFIFKTAEPETGEVIYCGSYLVHKQGKHSYLLKLRDRQISHGLFKLFDDELSDVLKKSSKIELKL